MAAACLLLSAALGAHCLASPADEMSLHNCIPSTSPSKLDYLVLASMADSPRPLALAGYRSSATFSDGAAPVDPAMADSIAMQFQRIVEARF